MPLHRQGFILVALFSCIVQGSQVDDNLRRWRNDQIESIRTRFPAVGETLILGVKHRKEFLRSTCHFHPPPNDIGSDVWYKVTDGVVYDNNDQQVDGIEAWDDGGDSSTCGIKILTRLPVFVTGATTCAISARTVGLVRSWRNELLCRLSIQ